LTGSSPRALVSVIVPAWNAERTLGETLRSAAAQTHPDLEILVVDDGSTDGTAEIAAAFCDADPRFRLIRKQRGGLASARNAGIEEAKGAWIAPLDADDLWHPEKIERQLRTFAQGSEEVGLVYCWYRMVDEAGRVTQRPWAPVLEGSVFRQHLRLNFGTGSSPLIRRSALGMLRYSTELSRVAEGGCEDWLLQLQIAAEHEVACTRAFLVGYRQRPGSMSADAARMTRAHIRMYEILRREFRGRHRKTIDRELARWLAIGAIEGWRPAPGRALHGLAKAFRGAPAAAAATLWAELGRRLNPLRGSRFLKNHPSVGMSFFDLPPDAA
jgi:glycosyltransferase involved in cell wall biosynthesis